MKLVVMMIMATMIMKRDEGMNEEKVRMFCYGRTKITANMDFL